MMVKPIRSVELHYLMIQVLINMHMQRMAHFFLTYFTYQMDSAVHLVQELEGVRIIGNETHELLQRVPGW